MVLLPIQLSILLVTCLGWTYWLNQWLTDGTWKWQRSVVLFAAGFAIQILILQNLVYLNLPVRSVFWAPAAIGLTGLLLFYKNRGIAGQFDLRFRTNAKYAAAIFLIVFTGQSLSAVIEGPRDYYGKAHIDHLNYAFLAEFLNSEPISTPMEETNRQPWMIKGLHQKENRIGQSVAQAYLASLSLTSAKESYPALCSFLIALLAVSTFTLARSFSVPRLYCVLAALWVGLAPSTTRINVEGFLSQAAVLFVFPLIVIWVRLTQETTRFRLIGGGILLAYLLVSYTELFVIGMALLFLLTICLIVLWSRRQFTISAAAACLAVSLVPAYLPRAYRFAAAQYAFAGDTPKHLDALAPDGGTVYGWARAMVEFPPISIPHERTIITAIGYGLLILCLVGFASQARRNRMLLAALLLAPTLFLGALLSSPVLSRYPFMKICDSFVSFWVLLIVLGFARIGCWIRTTWSPSAARLLQAAPAGLIILALIGFSTQQALIARKIGALSLVAKPEFRTSLRYIAAHPERTYIILHPDALAAGWLAYEARTSKVYLFAEQISDAPMPPRTTSIAKLSETLDQNLVTIIGPNGYRDAAQSGGYAELQVENPQGHDGGGSKDWYWLGDRMTLRFEKWGNSKPAEHVLTFDAVSGPANPSPSRIIRITNQRTGEQKTLRFSGAAKLSVPIVLSPGETVVQIESVEPTAQLVRVPGDPRKLLSRLFNFTIGPAISESNEALPSPGKAPKPLLTP